MAFRVIIRVTNRMTYRITNWTYRVTWSKGLPVVDRVTNKMTYKITSRVDRVTDRVDGRVINRVDRITDRACRVISS